MLDMDQLLSLGIIIFSLLLTAASLIAYQRTRFRKFLIVSVAFFLYALKVLVGHIDIISPNINIDTMDLAVRFMDFLIIILFFAAVIIREGRKDG